MKHPIALFALFLVLAADSLCAGDLRVGGLILSDSGAPIAGATVTVNGVPATSDETGRYATAIEAADFYTLAFSAPGHFPMIHSFSALDFSWRRENEGVRIPNVTLVERAEGRVMLAFGGDAMMGRRFADPPAGEPVLIREGHEAGDTMALLRHIRPWLELADYTSVNLETQVMAGQPEAKAPKSYTFYSPPEALLALHASGVDYVTLGNNHTFDYLGPGLASTLDALEASGLGWSGAGMTETQSLESHRVDLSAQPFSFLGYVGWTGNFSPNQVARGTEKGGAAYGTAENVRHTVRQEALQGRLPVVQYHGSREYTDEPTLATETRLKQAIDDGAVLAIAHHPHIVQGLEVYNGRLIAYSMGNFIFDQIDYATKRSFLLYVWMDDGQLHRAEVMPIHIKGYTTVPATDTVRRAVLTRVAELSRRRGTAIAVSGGHAVILPAAQEPEAAGGAFHIPDTSPGTAPTVWSLADRPWQEAIGSVVTDPAAKSRVLLGMNLLPVGHFESHHLFDAPDRSWIEQGAQSVLDIGEAPSGSMAMRLMVRAGEDEGTIGMRTFERTFRPGTPTTFVAQAKVDAPAVVTVYQQWRKRNDKLQDALANNRLRAIGQLELAPGAWREIRFDFDSPRVTAVAYRILLTVEPSETSSDHVSWFDDLALIEWLGPPLSGGPVPHHVATGQASHAGLWRPPSD